MTIIIGKFSYPNSIRSNQEPLKYGTVKRFGLTPTVNVTRLCVLTSYFKGKKRGRRKLESSHYSGAPYLYSQELMGNASCLLSLFIRTRITPKISITTSNWTGHSITPHMATLIETGGLSPWPNYPTYTTPLLSTTIYSSSVDMIVTSNTAP